MRLNKWIAARGIASRREADRLIAAGRVRVNGKVVTEMGVQVDPDRDQLEVDTEGLSEKRYVALHKPAGYVTSNTPTPAEPKVVTDLVPLAGLYPIGRLDKETTGLILLTDDGTLVTALNHPEAQKEKEYEVTVDKAVPDGALKRMAEGMPMMGTRTRPARVKRLGENKFSLTLTEGKNRQVRRMCRKVGLNVISLIRVRIANLTLKGLKPGKWRHLTPEEVAQLRGGHNPLR